MCILPQLENLKTNIDNISLNLFIIESNLKMIDMLNNVPDDIQSVLSNPEFNNIVDLSNNYLIQLKGFIDKINPKLKSAIYHQKHKSEGEPYAGFTVDEKPLIGYSTKDFIQKSITQSFEQINNQAIELTGSPIPPINRKSNLEYKGDCPHCGAPNKYIYDNNNRGQLRCKACKNTFNYQTKKYKELGFFCPHCKYKLDLMKHKKDYLIYKCRNENCPFFLNSLKLQSENNQSIKTNTTVDKLHYIYRAFNFSINDVNKPQLYYDTKVDLNNIHHSPQVLGTILTLYINYGLSSRKVASLMWDLYNIKISHQTVMNYAEAASSHVQHLINKYPYNIGNVLTGDETYVNVSGKHHYVFFFSDTINKIITSWKIYPNRSTREAVESLMMSFNKYDKIPDDLLVITDANPIYNASQVFLSLNDINFTLQQVVGVSNKDEVSKQYRPYKQCEERLNRTYKQNYYGTNGYASLRWANLYMILYVAFFNFLRKHSSLHYKTPVEIESLNEYTFMFDKWIALINMSKEYI